MATLYIDFEQGNDNHGGTSFALLASGTNGRISSTTFSSSGASFPDDGSLIGQYLSIFNGTIYAIYQITAWVNSTSLTIAALGGGTALANQAVDRQYFIGGRWRTLTSGATSVRINAGDTIRVEASPDPTSLGINGTWTSSPLRPTRSISSSTNASPIVITSNNHGYANGDTIFITGHTTNTNANGTWEITNVTTNSFSLVGSTGNGTGGATGTARLRNNSVVKLESAVTANIASCGNRGQGRVAWTSADAGNVTVTLNTTDYKEGDCSDSINIGANFTTGRAAFFATGNLNLSGYQQVSFWVKQTGGSLGTVSLRLCSDTAGNTPVHTINMNSSSFGALNIWNPITVDFGTNLNSSIQSIAFYVDSDTGGATYLFSNIIACKASSSPDSLSLTSLIGKNTGTEPWIAIQSINGSRVFLDGIAASTPVTASLMGYIGTSETVLTYKREAVRVSSVQIANDSGAIGNTINLSGGWDRTDMSSQSGDTYLNFNNGTIDGFQFGNTLGVATYWNVSRLNIFRANNAYTFNNYAALTLNNIRDINNNSVGINLLNYGLASTVISYVSNITNISFNNNAIVFNSNNTRFSCSNIQNINSNSSTPVSIANSTLSISYDALFSDVNSIRNNNGSVSFNNFALMSVNNISNIDNNVTNGISLTNCFRSTVSNIGSISGTSSALSANTYTNVLSLSSCDNCTLLNISGVIGGTSAGIVSSNSYNNRFINVNTSGNVVAIGPPDNGATYYYNCNFNEATILNITGARNGIAYLQNINNNPNNHQIYMLGGLIASNNSIRNTASGISWAISPTITARNSSNPVPLSLAKVLVFANKLVTIKAYLRRNNTGLTVQLTVKGNQIAGVTNDVIAAITAPADTWQEVTLTFTPTETGVVELLGEAFGGTTFTGYIDDLTITQAP